MKRRWTCDRCGVTVLAPERMRMNDARRYCLPCTEESGLLKERVCLALEKLRAEKVERRNEAAKKQRAAKKRRAAKARSAAVDRSKDREWVDGLHVPTEVARLLRLDCWLGAFKGHTPAFNLTRSKGSVFSGRAWPGVFRMHFTIGLKCSAAEACHLLVHELAHLAAGENEGHGALFFGFHRAAVCEAYGVAPSDFIDSNLARYEDRDHHSLLVLEEAFRRKVGGC